MGQDAIGAFCFPVADRKRQQIHGILRSLLIQLFYATIQFDLPSFGQLERKKSKMMIIWLCSVLFCLYSSASSSAAAPA